MYQEMDESGQYQLDCRLDSERDLEENVNIMISFAHKQLEAKVGDNFVKNRLQNLLKYFMGLPPSDGLAGYWTDATLFMTVSRRSCPISSA